MKKCYAFGPKKWLQIGVLVAFGAFLSLNLQAQTAPAKQWDKTFGSNDSDELYSLQQTTDGGYILGGSSHTGIGGDKSQPSKGANDFWVLKLDANGNKLWDKGFGGSSDDRLYALDQTSDGGYILGGYSGSNISGDKSQNSVGGWDYWLVRIDGNGNKIWDKTFGSNYSEDLFSLKQTSDGGYIFGGRSKGIGGDKTDTLRGDWDYWVIKLDSIGNKTWDRTFGGSGVEILYALQQTMDGGYILGGYSDSGVSGNKTQPSNGMGDFWLVKLDPNGNKLWDKSIGGSGGDDLRALKQTADGGYILGGASGSGISGDKTQVSQGGVDFWVVKVNANGNKIWDKTFGGSNYDELRSLEQTSAGGFIIGGISNSGISIDKSQPSFGNNDYWVLELDSIGNKIWDKTLGGNSWDNFHSLQQTIDGGYILGGWSNSGIGGDKSQPSKGGNDIWIVKLGTNITGLKKSETNSNLSIFPNPNQGKFTLQLNNLTSPKAEITISDLLGRTILQQEFKTTSNQLSEEINLPGAKGIYLLQLKTGNQLITRKIVAE